MPLTEEAACEAGSSIGAGRRGATAFRSLSAARSQSGWSGTSKAKAPDSVGPVSTVSTCWPAPWRLLANAASALFATAPPPFQCCAAWSRDGVRAGIPTASPASCALPHGSSSTTSASTSNVGPATVRPSRSSQCRQLVGVRSDEATALRPRHRSHFLRWQRGVCGAVARVHPPRPLGIPGHRNR
jgi:hypothetical protein